MRLRKRIRRSRRGASVIYLLLCCLLYAGLRRSRRSCPRRKPYLILIGTSMVLMPEWTHAVPPFGAITIALALVTLSRGSGLLVSRLIGMTLSLVPRLSITKAVLPFGVITI